MSTENPLMALAAVSSAHPIGFANSALVPGLEIMPATSASNSADAADRTSVGRAAPRTERCTHRQPTRKDRFMQPHPSGSQWRAHTRNRVAGAAFALLLASLLTAQLNASPGRAETNDTAAAAQRGAALIYIANADEGGKLDIISAVGPDPQGFDTAFDSGDHIAVGNVDDDEEEEVLIADSDGSNDGSSRVDVHLSTFDSFFMDVGDDEDGFVVGDVLGGDGDEVIGADTNGGFIEFRSGSGAMLGDTGSNFDDDDIIAVGNVTGDAANEIVIANADGGGRIDVLDTDGNQVRPSFTTAFDDIGPGNIPDDMLLVGNIDGGDHDEILIANANDGDTGNGRIDVFDVSGESVRELPGSGFDTAYDDTDGRDLISLGDVTGDGLDDVVVANSEGNGRIDVHELHAEDGLINPTSFDLGGGLYDPGDGFIVGDAGQSIEDVDGDDIPDDVELNGIRDSNGELVLDLTDVADNEPVHPCRKDIVVEIDWMATSDGIKHKPDPAAIDEVQRAFAKAPVDLVADCPYGDVPEQDGINLVVMVDDEIKFQENLQLPGDFDVTKDANFDSGADFVRYNVWARDATNEKGNSDFGGRVNPGSAENDFLVLPIQPVEKSDGTIVPTTAGVELQTSLFMHELGHSIGLHHGGVTEESCKPNYLSVMNYFFDSGLTRQTGNGTERFFDFSAEALDNLNEAALREDRGLSGGDIDGSIVDVFTAWGTDPNSPKGEPFTAPADGSIDWNDENGIEDVAVPFELDGNAKNSCLQADAGKPLTGFDDWEFLNQGIEEWGDKAPPTELSALRRAQMSAFWDRVASPDRTIALNVPRSGFRASTQGVAMDEEHIYATHYYETVTAPHTSDQPGSLVVVDRDTLQVEARVEVGFNPTSAAVNPDTNRVYVVNRGAKSYSLSVIDSVTLQVVDTISLHQGPVDVAVNTRTNRVYISNPGQRVIQVVDGATNALLSPIPIGPGPQGLAVDETTNTLYVALNNRSFDPHVTAVGAVFDDGQTQQILPKIDLGAEGTQPNDVAVDPLAGRVYVAGLGGGGVQPSMIVLDSTTRQELARVPLKGPARAIAVNGFAHRVFAVGEGRVDIIDDGSFQVIRSLPAKLPFAIATETGLANRIYVGELKTGELTRLSTS